MTLRVALNRTPKEKNECCCECECCGEHDFTLEDMTNIQEQNEKKNTSGSITDIQCKINKLLREAADVPRLRHLFITFCSSHMAFMSPNHKTIVVKGLERSTLDKIAGWLRNNGYSTIENFNQPPHGDMLGSIYIYWNQYE